MRPIHGMLFPVIGLVAACSSDQPPSFGERLATQGQEVATIGETWLDGQNEVERGRALVEDGEDKVERGQDLIRQGEREQRRGRDLVERGQDRMAEAETQYQRLRPGESLSTEEQ